MRRAEPLVRIRPIYDHAWSIYPDRVKVPMDDGKVIEYQVVIKFPEPVMRSWLDRFNQVCFGYRRKIKR